MPALQCPRCKLINPGSASMCDCGWSFAGEAMGKPRHIPRRRDSAQGEGTSRGGYELAIGVGLLLLGIVATVVTYGHASSAGGGTYSIAYGAIGVGIGLIIRGLVHLQRGSR